MQPSSSLLVLLLQAFVSMIVALQFPVTLSPFQHDHTAADLPRLGVEDPAKCLTRHCPLHLMRCATSTACKTCTACMQHCAQDDTLCSTHCFFKYADPVFNRMTQCGVDAHCFPGMTWSNLTCPSAPAHRVALFDVQWLARAADMLVLRGSHPIYDCLPCQRLQFTAEADGGGVQTYWSTAVDGVVRGAGYALRQETPNSLVTRYSLFGMDVEEHYYIVDFTEDGGYVLYFYCGFGFGGEYQGALVYGRRDLGGVLPAEVETRFAAALEAVGLEKYVPKLSGFCRPAYKADCENF